MKKQRCHFADKDDKHSQSCDFPSSHAGMWQLDHKEGWAPKNRGFQIVVLEKTPESPLDNKEIKPVNPKGNQPWIFTGRTDAKALILWLTWCKEKILGKTLMLAKIKGRRRRGQQRMRWLDGITGHQWTWVWANSSRQWRNGKPGMLQSMGLQRVGHNLATEQIWYVGTRMTI